MLINPKGGRRSIGAASNGPQIKRFNAGAASDIDSNLGGRNSVKDRILQFNKGLGSD